jgi:YYY domain-containing protein
MPDWVPMLRDALFWSLSQKETYIWWAAVQLVGLAAFPLGFAFFRFLPDRGYSFSKPLGLVLSTYVLWIGATLGVVTNSRASIVAILVGLGLASLAVVWRQRDELRAFMRQRWPYVLLIEALFAVALAVAVSLRSYVSEIQWNEKPMDFAFLNAILRADSFPPKDPWLSGHTIPMYIFGHHIVAALTKLTGIASSATFNLGVALMAALAAVAVFGLVFNLLATRARFRTAVLFGLVGVGLLLVLANIEGVFELTALHGIGSKGFYGLLDINDLNGPIDCKAHPDWCTEWWPTGLSWWRASRIGTQWDWREFPFFSFLLGDLHAHLMSIPFVLTAMGIAYNTLRWDGVLDGRFWLGHPLRLLGTSVFLGALGYINTWDLPTFMALVAAMAAARNYLRAGRLDAAVAVQTAGFVIPLAALSFVLYLPFYLDFHPVGGSILPLEVNGVGFPGREALATMPHHFFYIWATILWPTASFVIVARGPWREQRSMLGWAMLPALIPFGLWVLLVTGHEGPLGFAEEAGARGAWWITLAFLLVAVTVAALALGHFLKAQTSSEDDRLSTLFPLALAGTALLLLLGTELYWVQDPVNIRANTVFRLNYQAWMMLSISGAVGFYFILSRWRAGAVLAYARRFTWAAVTVVLIGAGLVYPVIGSMNRTNGFRANPNVDGLAVMEPADPAQYEAIHWLQENVKGTPVILEAIGGDYTTLARVSARTGLPTVLGWPEHEERWRGSWEPQEGRREDVERAYETTSPAEAEAILDKYGVEYVYIGELEREVYGDQGMAKFAQLGDVVFQNDYVTIYRIGG